MSIQLELQHSYNIPYARYLVRLGDKVLESENVDGPVNLIFCEDAYMRQLNKSYRNLDKTTDVLSFVYQEPDIWGEIYISADKAKRQAPKWGNSYYQELRRLVVHGALHLAGYDHMLPKERQIMRSKEEFYLKS